MFHGITVQAQTALPVVSAVCFTLGTAIAGRNAFAGAGSKAVGLALQALGKDGSEWNKTGDHYLAVAKKNVVRDLTAGSGLIVMGLAGLSTANLLTKIEEANPKKPEKPEQSYFEVCMDYANSPVDGVLWVAGKAAKMVYDYRIITMPFAFMIIRDLHPIKKIHQVINNLHDLNNFAGEQRSKSDFMKTGLTHIYNNFSNKLSTDDCCKKLDELISNYEENWPNN